MRVRVCVVLAEHILLSSFEKVNPACFVVCLCVREGVRLTPFRGVAVRVSGSRGVGSLSIWPQLTLPSQRHSN